MGFRPLRIRANIVALAAMLLAARPAPGAPAAGAARPAAIARSAVRDTAVHLQINELDVLTTNYGMFANPTHPFGLAYGVGWPRGMGLGSLVYDGGLWIGARVAADTEVTVASYTSEFAAGPLAPDGTVLDPTESDPAYRVYRITRGDGPGDPDWDAWPIAIGAPSQGGQPKVLGDQTLWCVYNDAVAAHHTAPEGGTLPLGVEVRQTLYGFNRLGALGRAAFVEFEIDNRGPYTLDQAYLAFWADADLGGGGDDLVGCDTTLDLGYTYNGDDDDLGYGAHPPALGIAVLQGPIVGSDTLGMTSFGRLLKDYNEPTSPGQAYRRMALGLPDPGFLTPSWACDAAGSTTFEVAGDPVAGTGCRDTLPADRRLMVSSGPFTMAPFESQRFVVAFVVGGRPGSGDRLSNLTDLLATTAQVRAAWNSGFASVPALPSRLEVGEAVPNPSDGVQSFELDIEPGHRARDLTIYDLAGRRVRRLDLSGLPPGPARVAWDGRDDDGRRLPPGIYLARFTDATREVVRRLVRLE